MTSQIENAVEVLVSVTVARPRAAVWKVLADVQRQPEWMRDALSIEMLTDGPMGVGSRMKVPTQIGIFRTTDIMEVTAYEPPERWTVVHRGLVTGEGTFTLRESDSGESTHVGWRERLAAPLGPLGRWGMTFVRPLLRRQFQSDLDRFRALCES
ncbi:MAG: SRPBCC family protein [Candidatus Binatia bacterium]|nr:SRPBCC family protein [Candidatus Binatia bacterium]